MIILFIVGLLLGAVAVFFALQNTTIITVSFFSWELTGSLALILSLAMGVGVLVTIFLILPETIKNYLRYKALERENKRLAEELRKQKEMTTFAKSNPATPETISKIEQGAAPSYAPYKPIR